MVHNKNYKPLGEKSEIINVMRDDLLHFGRAMLFLFKFFVEARVYFVCKRLQIYWLGDYIIKAHRFFRRTNTTRELKPLTKCLCAMLLISDR